MKKISSFYYLLVIAGITIIFGVIYVTVQQTYRTGANDPQIQLARDINARLLQGRPVEKFFTDTIDIAQSLLPFVALYDAAGKPLRSSGYLENKMPELPAGVFVFTKSHLEYRVTWQPRPGIRMAVELLSSGASPVGFVLAGRSLQEVEVREHNLVTTVFIGWIICVALVLLYAVIQFYNSQPQS
jgi:hypothetical protein